MKMFDKKLLLLLCFHLLSTSSSDSISTSMNLNVETTREEANNSDDFNNRHKRNPREHDKDNTPRAPPPSPAVAPSTDPCSAGKDMIYGSISTKQADVTYSYEIEIESNALLRLESEIIPAVEISISDSLARSFIKSCVIRNDTNRKMLQLITISNDEGQDRLLELLGIISEPLDKIDDSALCESDNSAQNSECLIVNGGMRFYFDEGTNLLQMETSVGKALSVIKANLNKQTYTIADEGILQMAFVQDSLTMYGIEEEFKIVPSVTIRRRSGFPKTLSFVLIGAITLALVIGSLIFGGREKKLEFITADHIDINSVLTDDHIYVRSENVDLAYDDRNVEDIDRVMNHTQHNDTEPSSSDSSIHRSFLFYGLTPDINSDEDTETSSEISVEVPSPAAV